MRLLKLNGPDKFSLVQVPSHDTFPYAILSHTWNHGHEVTFQDLIGGVGESKTGYEKIKFCGEQAFKDGLRYFWVDTCCIDKTNDNELKTAITSMFRWYRNAARCYVYLADVSMPGYAPNIQANQSTLEAALRSSSWFTRGWTLQELIAPTKVEFFSKEGNQIGDKKSLENLVHHITRIPIPALRGACLSNFSIAERRAWVEDRRTQIEEDIVYCLIGICEVSMPIIYGEGKDHAVKRLEMTVEGFSKNRSDLGKKFVEIRRWLSAPDPSFNYQKARRLCQPNTGLWLLESESYLKWKRDEASFLWLYGIPGCGKTILSSTIIQDIISLCTNDPDKSVAYFDFDFNDVDKRIPELMVRSLISQLSEQCIKMPPALEDLYSSLDKGNRKPSLDVLVDVLKQILGELSQPYLILDALDECEHRMELMKILEEIAGWQLKKLHVLITSREERDIQKSLENIVTKENMVSLQSEIVDEDIQLYVRQRLLDDQTLDRWRKDPGIRGEIETSLAMRSHGMFRWAVCQLDELRKCRSKAALRRALQSLPATLDETYERILCAISDNDSIYAVRILRWLVFTRRPLLVKELAEIAAINVEQDRAFDRDEILEDPLDVLNICSSLVSKATTHESLSDNIDDGSVVMSLVINLAHYSVEEYLRSDRIYSSRAAQYSTQPTFCHGYIAKGCLTYLLQFEKGLLDRFENTKAFQEVYALARYAAKHWISHVSAAREQDDQLAYQVKVFLSTKDGAYLSWLRIHNPDSNYPGWRDIDFQRQINELPDPLYYVCLGGLARTTSNLIEGGADVNAQGGTYGNALQVASGYGYDNIVELLLNKGANVNARGGYYNNALYIASYHGHDNIVELLLNKGADINAQGGEFDNALQAASYNSYDSIIKLLLNKGANINIQGGYYSNALYVASFHGHDNIVKLLLNKGANVNAQGGTYGNALQVASGYGCDNIVELLLNKGANVNAQGGYYGNALQAASYHGHDNIVELLLNKGADVNAQGGEFGNALQAASYNGCDNIVELLLNKGANVNAQGGYYGNALQAASYHGYYNTVELLLDKGADVNAQGGRFGTVAEQRHWS